MRFLRVLSLIVVMCPGLTLAQPVADPSPTIVLATVALNGSLAARTTSVYSVSGYSGLKISTVAVRTAYTDLSLLCYESDDYSTQAAASATWYEITKTDSSDAVSIFNPTYTTNASHNWSIVLEVGGYKYVYCTITATTAGADDSAAITFKKTRGY